MQSRAHNRANSSPATSVSGQKPEDAASSQLSSFAGYSGDIKGNATTRFVTPDGIPLEKDIPPPLPIHTDSAAVPIDTPDQPLDSMARMTAPYPETFGTHNTNSPWPPYDASPNPSGGHFAAYGVPVQPPNPGGYAPEANAHSEEGPVSPLNVALIVLILLAGLGLGIGRSWWIDEKLEASSAKSSSVTKSSSSIAADEPSSIQASIDRAYIPPQLDPDSDPNAEEKVASVPAAPAPVDKALGPSGPPSTQVQTPVPPQPVKAESPRELTKSNSNTSNAAPQEPRPEGTAARPEKKQYSRKEATTQKPASATRKERLKEIDRVRSQAFSETSKDRVGERKSAAPDSSLGPQSQRRSTFRTNKVAQTTVTNSQYARCERINHIIRREQCKWELCNNKWGKGACPAFRHERPFLY